MLLQAGVCCLRRHEWGHVRRVSPPSHIITTSRGAQQVTANRLLNRVLACCQELYIGARAGVRAARTAIRRAPPLGRDGNLGVCAHW